MPLLATPILMETTYSEDARGNFSKPFSLPNLMGDDYAIREIFWSTSARGVIRGMHFQLPPKSIGKIVWVSRGSAVDVVVDVRNHDGYGDTTAFELDATSGKAVWVPSGFAHGFQALEDETIVNYAVDGDFDPVSDAGVRWDSLGVDWPLEPGSISARDQALPTLDEFVSPFEVSA
jgi:dTDP-4-dehydrorhamnose 3,5-epimerase